MIAVTALPLCVRVQAQGGADEIPQLHPPHAELPPTLWEQHGGLILVAGLMLVGLAGLVLWLRLRGRPPVVVPPAVQARAALAALPATAEPGVLLSRVSRILREYLRRSFILPADECTTAELCRLLSQHPMVGPELAGALADFLRDNDRSKFSPAGPAQPPADAVARALTLIQMCETRLAGLRAAQAAAIPANQAA